MNDSGIPSSVQDFVHEHIDSVLQLEVLLLLHANAQRAFSAADIGRELCIAADWAAAQLVNLHGRGILQTNNQRPDLYQFTSDARMAGAVAELARAYADRRVSLIALIFSKPVDKLRSFSDAFRLRKERPDG